jgi:hypothetical protein
VMGWGEAGCSCVCVGEGGDLVGHSENIGGDVANTDDQEYEQLDEISGYSRFHAKGLGSVVQRVPHPYQARSYDDHILSGVPKLCLDLRSN